MKKIVSDTLEGMATIFDIIVDIFITFASIFVSILGIINIYNGNDGWVMLSVGVFLLIGQGFLIEIRKKG